MNNISETLAWLDATSVRFRPKSMDVFDRVLEFAKTFEALSADQRAEVLSMITDNLSKKLLAFSAFFSEIALSTNDPKWIRGAIVLHLIEDFRQDYRENIRYLVLIDYAAKKIGVELKLVICDVDSMSSPRSREYLAVYSRLDQSSNTLESFGVRLAIVDGKQRFVPLEN